MLLTSRTHLGGTWLFQGCKRTLSAATPQWVTEALSLCYLWENELEVLVWDQSWAELKLELWMPLSLLPESRTCCPLGCACLWHDVVLWCCFGGWHATVISFSGQFACSPLTRVGTLLCSSARVENLCIIWFNRQLRVSPDLGVFWGWSYVQHVVLMQIWSKI